MKSTLRKLFALVIFSSIFSATLFAASGEVISAKGKVEVARGDEWVPLKVGDIVSQSDVISTGFQSEAKIKMGNSVLQLGALSRVTLETIASNSTKEVVDVYLNTGAVRSKITHTSDNKKTNYTVRNPIAVASVRGTDFTFADNGSVECFEGGVAIAPASSYEPEALEGGKEADDVEDPADGESDAATPATDIAPSSPKGSVVVLGGQKAAITVTGGITTPQAAATSSVTKAATAVATAASAESVAATPTPAASSPVVEPVTPAVQTVDLLIDITWESDAD